MDKEEWFMVYLDYFIAAFVVGLSYWAIMTYKTLSDAEILAQSHKILTNDNQLIGKYKQTFGFGI